MKDAIGASRAPVIFSYSSARGLVGHLRNVPYEVLQLLPANGGVVMVNFVPDFVSDATWHWGAEKNAEEARLKVFHRNSKSEVEAGLKAWEAAHPRPEATVATVADHIDHVAKVAGHDHVGLGGDFDGIPYTPVGLTGVHDYPALFAELIRRGWSDRDLAKLAGGNVLRAAPRRSGLGLDEKRSCLDGGYPSPQMTAQPLRAAIVPVTPLQQNCSLLWCTETMLGAFVDPGGDLDRLKAAAAQHGVTIEKILLTHGHIDHCGQAGILAQELGVPIEGPHEEDLFWIARLEEDGQRYGINGKPFLSDRYLVDGDTVTVGELTFNVRHCPGHTPGHVVFHHPESKLAIVGDVLFQGSIGRTDFPRGNHQQLLDSITQRLWPMGGDTAFVPGHGPMSTFAHERASNPFVGDAVLAA
jgi:glyoxylase-like metal-dependent hydrolase (beta-lactamase superfamily II)